MAIGDLAGALDQLFDEGVEALADGASVVALLAQLARLEALATEAVGSFDASRDWALDGSKSASSWLATRGHLRTGDARRHLSRARHLAHLPACRAAWEQGEVTGAHVDVLARVDHPRTEAALARDEETLAGHAKGLRFGDFTRVVAYWEQFADPDGTEDRAERARCRRDVTLTESAFGTWLGAITLDAVAGSLVADELDRLGKVLFEADRRDATERLGRAPTADELLRTSAQRRADALVEMAARSKTSAGNALRPAPLFTVLVDYDTLSGRICQLAGGTVVTPGSLVPYLDEALVERAVFAPDGRVEVSETARFFTGATRRAIELRDQRCTHPTCEVPYTACEADHIVPAGAGGLTTQDNGRLLCPFHNKLRNRMDDAAWDRPFGTPPSDTGTPPSDAADPRGGPPDGAAGPPEGGHADTDGRPASPEDDPP